MTALELTQLRQRFENSSLLRHIPETPNGNFEELLLHALDYAELYTVTLNQARELKDLLKRQSEFLRTKSNEAERLRRAVEIENELLDYKEI